MYEVDNLLSRNFMQLKTQHHDPLNLAQWVVHFILTDWELRTRLPTDPLWGQHPILIATSVFVW